MTKFSLHLIRFDFRYDFGKPNKYVDPSFFIWRPKIVKPVQLFDTPKFLSPPDSLLQQSQLFDPQKVHVKKDAPLKNISDPRKFRGGS